MRVAFAVVLLVAAAHASVPRPFSPDLDHTRSHNVGRALALLDQAHELCAGLPPEQRALLTFEATEVAAPVDRERGERWALEVWDLSRKLERGQDRTALQKNSLRDLAINDPAQALRLARHEDLPSTWDAVYNVTEDARALGYANTLFKPVWERGGPRYLAQLRKLARYLGSTGQYPYGAMGKIALDVSKTNPRGAEKLLREATSYFVRDPGFTSTNSQFTRMILATRRIASVRTLREELSAAATALQRPPVVFKSRNYHGVATTPAGTANFDSENEALLYQLLPLIKMYLPQTATALLDRYASLRSAPAVDAETRVTVNSVVSLSGTADPTQMQSRLDESRIYQVQTISDSDPQTALSIARQISDADLRAIALATLAPSYASIDAKQSDEWLLNAQSRIDFVSDASMRIRLIKAVASAQLALHRDADVLIQKTLDLGELAFSKDRAAHPDDPAYSLAGYDELTDLAVRAIQSKSEESAVVARIDRVAPRDLRAALLISSAKGLLEE